MVYSSRISPRIFSFPPGFCFAKSGTKDSLVLDFAVKLACKVLISHYTVMYVILSQNKTTLTHTVEPEVLFGVSELAGVFSIPTPPLGATEAPVAKSPLA